jgi:hypothetical protein
VKAILLLCDAASSHPDGTFSLLRGGITECYAPADKPVVFDGAVVVRIVGSPAESGSHEFRLQVVNEDGHSVAPKVEGSFHVPSAGGAVQLVLNIQLVFPKHGRYEFSISVDKIPQPMVRTLR